MTPGAMSLSENKNQHLTFSLSFCLFDSKPFCEAVKVGVEDCFFPSTLREFHSSVSFHLGHSSLPNDPAPIMLKNAKHHTVSETFPRNTQHETYKEKKEKIFVFALSRV